MTWIVLDIAALALLVLFVIIGRHRGFLAMALLLVGTLASLWAAQQFAQPAAQWVYDNYARARLTEYVEEKLEETGSNDIGLLAGVLEQITDEAEPLAELESLKEKAQGLLDQVKQFAASQSQQDETVLYPEGIDPDDTQQGLIEQMLAEGQTLSEALVEIMLKPLVLSFLELLAFLVIFIVCSAVIKLLIRASRLFNKVPLLGGVNRFFGGVCGLMEGVLVLYVVGIVLRIAAAAASADSLITTQLLQQTKLLSSIIYFLN